MVWQYVFIFIVLSFLPINARMRPVHADEKSCQFFGKDQPVIIDVLLRTVSRRVHWKTSSF